MSPSNNFTRGAPTDLFTLLSVNLVGRGPDDKRNAKGTHQDRGLRHRSNIAHNQRRSIKGSIPFSRPLTTTTSPTFRSFKHMQLPNVPHGVIPIWIPYVQPSLR